MCDEELNLAYTSAKFAGDCLRLMGFCDSFKIVVSDTSMYQQAGNLIVVDVLINIPEEQTDRTDRLTIT